ncbi:MAG: sigma-70 family RNA polymerase sigma factor, partial [Alistipes sp.]|nr:sigma-70 family RNA polymerase sigma factor [Alistipes sp.]
MKNQEAEFTKIVREHKTTIYTVCYMFSKDKDEVEELFQEILISLWQGFSSFRGECNIRSWIYRISLNTCISAERKKSRRPDTLHLNMNINLFSDTDEESRQVQMLRQRIG